MAIHLKSIGMTDVGRVRSSNQDSLFFDDDRGLYIVADGMGGHAGGEIASSIAIEEITKFLAEPPKGFSEGDDSEADDPIICQWLAQAVNHASRKIYERALEEPTLKGMGTTTTLLLVMNQKAYCAHVGDSRLYLIRNGFLYQITYDHSLVNEQVRAGIITAEEAEIHHLKNVITRSVGYQEEEDVDTTSFDLNTGDCILICSDGLHGKVTDREISNIVREQGLDAVKSLMELANNRGGDDNITIIVIEATS